MCFHFAISTVFRIDDALTLTEDMPVNLAGPGAAGNPSQLSCTVDSETGTQTFYAGASHSSEDMVVNLIGSEATAESRRVVARGYVASTANGRRGTYPLTWQG